MIRHLSPLPKSSFGVGRPQAFDAQHPLRILIDRPTVTDYEALSVLVSLVDAESDFEIWTTTPSSRWVDINWEHETNGSFSVRTFRPEGSGLMALWAGAINQFAVEVASRNEVSTAEARRQLGVATWAKDYEISLLVTDSPILLAEPFQLGVGTNLRSARDSLAIVAQLERGHGRYDLGDPAAYGGPVWFYLIGSRTVPPLADRWFSACQASTGLGEDVLAPDAAAPTLRALAQTALERVDWVLRTRDLLAAAADTAVMPLHLDTILVQLSAAFDAVAWVTSYGLNVKAKSGSPSWRNSAWKHQLATKYESFVPLLEPGSVTADAIEILSLPRNSIHSAGMPRLGMARAPFLPARTAVRIPRGRHANRLVEAVLRQGGLSAWGMEQVLPGSHVLDPLVFSEKCVTTALKAFNAIIEATPLEQFPDAGGKELRGLPWPDKGPTWPWSEWTRRRTLLVLGLSDDFVT